MVSVFLEIMLHCLLMEFIVEKYNLNSTMMFMFWGKEAYCLHCRVPAIILQGHFLTLAGLSGLPKAYWVASLGLDYRTACFLVSILCPQLLKCPAVTLPLHRSHES